MTPEETAKRYLAHDRYGADAKGLSQAYLDLIAERDSYKSALEKTQNLIDNGPLHDLREMLVHQTEALAIKA